MARLLSQQAVAPEAQRPPIRVLIVEDETLIAMHAEAALEEQGFVVVGTAASSRQAVAIAESEMPDVAVVDLNLIDGSTGLRLAQQLHSEWRCGIVMATANPEAVRDAPFVSFTLAKPYHDAALVAAVVATAANWEGISASLTPCSR